MRGCHTPTSRYSCYALSCDPFPSFKNLRTRRQSRCSVCNCISHKQSTCRVLKRKLKSNFLNVVGSHRKIEVRGYVESHSRNLLIDSGAGLSCVSHRIINDHAHVINVSPICVRLADGHKMKIVGQVNLRFQIEGCDFYHNFIVLEGLLQEVILGNDFLELYKANISFRESELQLVVDDNSYSFPFLRDNKIKEWISNQPTDRFNEEFKVVVSNTVEVPPRSARRVPVHSQLRRGGVTLQVNPQFVYSRSLWIPEGYYQGGLGDVIVINSSHQPAFVYEGACVGVATVAERSDTTPPLNQLSVSTRPSPHTSHSDPQEFNINPELSDKDYAKFNALLNSYRDVFAWSLEDLQVTQIYEHGINTGDAEPIHQTPYRTAPKERELIREQVKEMLESKIISPSRSPWAFPIVLVKKKTGEYRFCVDYRKLNDLIDKAGGEDRYPLPLIDDLIGHLEGNEMFTTLDLMSGYWQIPLKEEDKAKTAFVTPEGLYQFEVLPFGLSTAPRAFQRTMDCVLAGLKWSTCLVYLDDIVVKSKLNTDSHLEKLKQVFDRFRSAKLKLKPQKCNFGFTEVKLLGHVISSNGVSPDPDKIKAVLDFPTPTKIKDVQSFLGLANYYRKFIINFSERARPLTLLTRKNTPFCWTSQANGAFEDLRTTLLSAPVLRHFDPKLPTELHTDASGFGIGGILLQIENGVSRPVCYISRRLSDPEMKFSVTEKEALAIVWSLGYLRHYLWGNKFKIVTDHHALCYLKKNNDPYGRLARWSLKLQEFSFDIVHKSGRLHGDADALSRNPILEPTPTDEETDFLICALEEVKVEELQLKDPQLRPLIAALKDRETPDAKVAKKSRSYCLVNNRLHKKVFIKGIVKPVLVVPEVLKQQILLQAHDSPLTGAHLGFAKTMGKIKDRYFWEGMCREVERYVKSCQLCQKLKKPKQAPAGMLQPIPPGNAFDKLGVDVLGPFPKSHKGNKYVIVATDYATRWVETQAVPTATAVDIADFLIQRIVCRHGCPKVILTDRGSCFTAKLVQELMKSLGINPVKTTAYHPQANGLTERQNATIAKMIAPYVNTNQRDWDEFLPLVTFSLNTSVQASTKFTAFFLVYGRHATFPLDIQLDVQTDDNIPLQEYLERLDSVRQSANDNLRREQVRQKARYDGKHRELHFKVGDKVLMYAPRRKVGRAEKLLKRWFGPYTIQEIRGKVNYVIERRVGARVYTDIVHVSRLKPYYERNNLG